MRRALSGAARMMSTGGAPGAVSAVTRDTKGVDHARTTRHYHVCQAGEGC
jgi:hypothetical protein